jgi:hypothetical protein
VPHPLAARPIARIAFHARRRWVSHRSSPPECRNSRGDVRPDQVARVEAGGAAVVDIRPIHQREGDGARPDVVVMDRTVLQRRL